MNFMCYCTDQPSTYDLKKGIIFTKERKAALQKEA